MNAVAADFAFVFVMVLIAIAVSLEGAVSAGLAFWAVIFSGLAAMNWYEALSDGLTSLAGVSGPLTLYRDLASLLLIFILSLLLMRYLIRRLLPESAELPSAWEVSGRWTFGFLTGYVAAAILLTAVHTYPGTRDFGGYFPPAAEERPGPLMQLAPDYQWLAFTQHVSRSILGSPSRHPVFAGTASSSGNAGRPRSFPQRYAAWRWQLQQERKKR